MSGKSPHDRGLRMDRAGRPPSDEDSVEAILVRLESDFPLFEASTPKLRRRWKRSSGTSGSAWSNDSFQHPIVLAGCSSFHLASEGWGARRSDPERAL